MSTSEKGATGALFDPTNGTTGIGIRMLNSTTAGTSHAVRHSESESEDEDPQ